MNTIIKEQVEKYISNAYIYMYMYINCVISMWKIGEKMCNTYNITDFNHLYY